MTTRRQFLGASAAAAATGIVFCDCGLPHDAHAQQLARQKLPVRIGGKRVKTIDVHAHCAIVERIRPVRNVLYGLAHDRNDLLHDITADAVGSTLD